MNRKLTKESQIISPENWTKNDNTNITDKIVWIQKRQWKENEQKTIL